MPPGDHRATAREGDATGEPVIAAYWIKGLAVRLGEESAVVGRALAEARIPRTVLDDPSSPVTYAQELAFIDALAALTHNPVFGAEHGIGIDPRRTSLLSYLVFNAPTLGHGLANAERYLRLVRASALTRLMVEGERVHLVIDNDDPLIHRNRQHAEFVAATAIGALRIATGTSLAPLRVRFQHERREDVGRVAEILGARTRFGCERFELILARGMLDLPLVERDGTLVAILERHAAMLLGERRRERASMRHRVERAVLGGLQRGAPAIETVAAALGLSARTLARRLADEGCHYREVVDALRLALAESYLADRALSLAEIAFLLGYADQSAFTTAFKRWTGTTPRERRTALVA